MQDWPGARIIRHGWPEPFVFDDASSENRKFCGGARLPKGLI